MNKNFDNEHSSKSSDDCKKYSKRFLYKNLVGGTATTGKEHNDVVGIEGVITRRTLVRRGYLPEQGTHANEESLFANVTCFMRLPRRIQRMLLVMTIPTLALVLTLTTISESKAECATGIIACGDDCAADDGKSTCHWEIDSNGKMTVTGSGAMKDYKVVNGVAESKPWGRYREKYSSVDIKGINHVGSWTFNNAVLQSVSFDDTVTSIGGSAFRGNQLTSLSLPDKIESIGGSAFEYNNLTSVVLPDSIKKIEGYAFNSNNLTSVVLPDSLESLADFAFNNNPLSEIVVPDTLRQNIIRRAFGGDAEMLENLRIECKGDNASCQKLNKLLKKYGYKYDSKTGWLYMDLSHRIFGVGQENCDSTNFYWNGKECIREPDVTKRKCCADVCKDVGGWCNRIRYTPAEAAEVLRDDDKNEVTITFKK